MPIQVQTAHANQEYVYHQITGTDTAGDLGDWYESVADPAFAPASGVWCTDNGDGSFTFHTVLGDSEVTQIGDYVVLLVVGGGGQPWPRARAADFPHMYATD